MFPPILPSPIIPSCIDSPLFKIVFDSRHYLTRLRNASNGVSAEPFTMEQSQAQAGRLHRNYDWQRNACVLESQAHDSLCLR